MRRALTIAALLLAAGCAQPNESARRGLPLPPFPQVAIPQAEFVVVDKSERTLTLFAQGRPYRIYRGLQLGDEPEGDKHFEGDERTPEGRYTIDTRNPASAYHLSLHISYPDAADRTFAARVGRPPGGAIFIHGQPNWLPRGRLPGDWTDGCIALSNAEIEELWRLVPDGTPIEIQT
jgi:murein L,D-transpeptidase YafK